MASFLRGSTKTLFIFKDNVGPANVSCADVYARKQSH